MGTGLQEKSKKIKKKVSMYSLLLVPAIAVGMALLVYQSYMLYSGKSIKDINFDIGKLWKSDKSNVDAPIAEEDLIIMVVAETQNIAKIQPPVPPKLSSRPELLPAKQVDIVKPAVTTKERVNEIFHPMPLDRINKIEIPLQLNNPLIRRYVQQMENDFLINPDLVGERGRWFIGISFAPSINYRTFNYSPGVSGTVDASGTRYVYGMTESYRDQTDKAVSSYYTGVDLGVNIGKRIDLASGLYYSIYGESISVTRVEENDINATDASYYAQTPLYNSPENTEKPTTIAYSNRFAYVEIPITISVLVVDRLKSDISIQAGIYGQMLDHANALVYDFNTDYYYWMNRTDYEIYRKYGFGVSGGIMLSQFIGNRLEVFVNPQFKYNLTSTFKQPYPVNQNQYATGLRLGFRQHFKP